VVENRIEGLLVRAQPLEWAQEISQRLVDVVRVEDGVLLLEADLAWARAINAALVEKGMRVSELRSLRRSQQTSYQPTTRQRSSL
jgi:hypothetical protein